MLPGIKLFDLSGKTAVITGGSKGLGKAMADGLASAGANLMLVSRNQAEANATATGCEAQRIRAAVACNVALSTAIEETATCSADLVAVTAASATSLSHSRTCFARWLT